MSATGLRGGVAKVRIAVAVVAGTMVVSGCAASHYQQISCSGMSRQSIFLLEAQAVPSATLIPCVLPLPGAGATAAPRSVPGWPSSGWTPTGPAPTPPRCA